MKQTHIIFFFLYLLIVGSSGVLCQSSATESADKSKINNDFGEKKHFSFSRKDVSSFLKTKDDEDFDDDNISDKKFYGANKYFRRKSVAQQSDDPPPISTDRPSFSFGTAIIPTVFKAQIESGYTYTRSGGSKNHSLGEILVRVPVAESVELRFGVPTYQFQRGTGSRASGFGDAAIGAKFKLTDSAENPGLFRKPATSIIVNTTLPVGSEAFGEDELQPQAAFILSTGLVEKVGLLTNVGYLRASDGGNNYNQFFGSVLLSRSLTSRLGGYFEVYGLTRTSAASRAGAGYANSGLTFLINNNSQIDARIGVGLGNNVSGPDYFTGFGYSQRF